MVRMAAVVGGETSAAGVVWCRSGWIGFVVTDVRSEAGGRNSSSDGAGKDGGGEVVCRVVLLMNFQLVVAILVDCSRSMTLQSSQLIEKNGYTRKTGHRFSYVKFSCLYSGNILKDPIKVLLINEGSHNSRDIYPHLKGSNIEENLLVLLVIIHLK
ncbi:hypothetical protein Tco_1338797 [Tanacetum coccineum]